VPRTTFLHRLALATHLGLALAVVGTFATLDLAPAYRLTIVLLALLPLVTGLPGLVARRRASLQWLAVALVIYVGLGTVEVIARGHVAAIALLLLALLELALALSLTRATPPQSPRGSGES
jgi:uncharacterized membrane protein